MKQKRFILRMIVSVGEFDQRDTATKVAASVLNAIDGRGMTAKITTARAWGAKGKGKS